jgi:hypothetical protein
MCSDISILETSNSGWMEFFFFAILLFFGICCLRFHLRVLWPFFYRTCGFVAYLDFFSGKLTLKIWQGYCMGMKNCCMLMVHWQKFWISPLELEWRPMGRLVESISSDATLHMVPLYHSLKVEFISFIKFQNKFVGVHKMCVYIP